MTFEYKCVAGPTIVAVKSAKARDHAVKAFEDIMNAEAAQGWEYVGIDEFHVSEPQGLFTRKRVYVPSKILVFRREKARPVAAALPATSVAAAPAPQALAPPPAPEPVRVMPEPTPSATPAAAMADEEARTSEPAPQSMRTIAEKLKIIKT